MKIYKINEGIVIEHNYLFHLSPYTNWDDFINRDNLYNTLQKEIEFSMQSRGKENES